MSNLLVNKRSSDSAAMWFAVPQHKEGNLKNTWT